MSDEDTSNESVSDNDGNVSDTLLAEAPTAAPTSFLDAIDPQYRNDPSLSGFNNVNDLVKEHVNLQSLLGRKGVVMPKEGDSPEVWSKYRQEMGIPEESVGYLNEHDLDNERYTHLANVAHQNNLSQNQFNELMTGYVDYYAKIIDESEKESSLITEDQINSLKKEWGRSFEAKTNISSSALNQITKGSPDVIANLQLSDGTLLGNNPAFIKALASVGEILQEKGLLQGDTVNTSAMSPDEAQQKLAQLMSDPEKSAVLFSQDFHPMKQELVKERERLLKFAYPNN
jgi:hypothetical protein